MELWVVYYLFTKQKKGYRTMNPRRLAGITLEKWNLLHKTYDHVYVFSFDI